ncbi:MAG: hypothetical protein K2Q24_10575 [Chitinophagaceae bacterium]|jgi:hypothetical protein|nr:hypothetical protein [Chitinophagaceae bacterium]
MKKILLALICILLLQSSYSQIRYDNGGIRDGNTQIGEFVIQGNSWNQRFVTYFFQNTTNDIVPQAIAREAIRQAFATWQGQSRLISSKFAMQQLLIL